MKKVARSIIGLFGWLFSLAVALVLIGALIYDYRKGALEWD